MPTHFSSAVTHPSFQTRGITIRESKIGNVLGNNSPRADKTVRAERNTADNRSVGSDGCPLFYMCFAEVLRGVSWKRGPRIDDVGKYHRGTAEDIILENNTLVHRNVILDLNIVSDNDIVSDKDILPDFTIFSDADL